MEFTRFIIIIIIIIITYADGSRGSIATIRFCYSMILSARPNDKTKTAEHKITKLGTGMYHDTSIILSQKVKVQSHRVPKVQKHIEDDRVAGLSYALYRVPTL